MGGFFFSNHASELYCVQNDARYLCEADPARFYQAGFCHSKTYESSFFSLAMLCLERTPKTQLVARETPSCCPSELSTDLTKTCGARRLTKHSIATAGGVMLRSERLRKSVKGVCSVYAPTLHLNLADMFHNFVRLHSKPMVCCVVGLNAVTPFCEEWMHAYIFVQVCFACARMCGIDECCTLSVWGMKMS